MRISDWSSDVCSSDLVCLTFKEMCGTGKSQISFAEVPLSRATEYAAEDAEVAWRLWTLLKLRLPIEGGTRISEIDRKSVLSGKRVSVRVDFGGRRIIKKKIQSNVNTT